MKISDSDVLLVVDVQNDFCSNGALAVPEGEKVVPAINRIAQCFSNVVLTQDWHPANHVSFASNHAHRSRCPVRRTGPNRCMRCDVVRIVNAMHTARGLAQTRQNHPWSWKMAFRSVLLLLVNSY